MKHVFSLIILSFLFPVMGFCQVSILGVVTEKGTAEPLVGVIIREKGTKNGAMTDAEGAFSMKVGDANATLGFSYLGFQSVEFLLEGKTKVQISMQQEDTQLDDVVITALGIKRQKKELGYSTDRVGGEELAVSNAPNVINALSGKSAGVQVTTPNGVDGGTSRIVIRGNNNINANNQPLIVVDGVPLENTPGLTDIGRGVDWGSAINNINPEDIQDITILKGPTAAALYGARGGNGVVLITTKRGKKQKGIGIRYSVNHKSIQPFRYRDVQNTYGSGGPVSLVEPQLELNAAGEFAYPNSIHETEGPFGKSTTELFGFYSSGVSWGPEMKGQSVRWWDGEMRDYSPQPDNLKLYFQDGHTTTHNVSFSGGGEMGTMRVSVSGTNHKAVIPNSGYDQYTANIGANLNVSDKVKADIALSYINFNRLNSPTLGDDNNNSFGKGILYSWPRSYQGIEKETNILPNGTRNNYGGNYPFSFSPPNLWWNTYHQNTTLERNKLIGALTLTYEIFPWLSAMGRIGMDFNLDEFETRHDPIDALGINGGYYSNELTRNQVLNNEFLISAHKDGFIHENFDVKLSVGGTQWQRRLYGIKAQSGTWVNPQLFNFNNFSDPLSVPAPTEVRFNKNINSLYGFLNMGYKDYVFLEVAGRNDWSSALPIENNSYFYPSASVSFIASEAFSLPKKIVNFMKLRAAFAQTASDTDPFQVDFVYTTGNFGNMQTATLPSTIPPIGLQPQQANSYEVGTTIGLFEDIINLDVTYYYINSFNQILNSPLPASSGASEIRINTGELVNRGWEAALDVTIWKSEHGFARTGINLSRNRNNVVSLGEGADILELANIWGLNGPAIAVRAGEQYGTIVGYDYVYHENGQPILNEEGTHYQISNNRVPIGNSSPDFIGGWHTQLSFKGIELRTLVDTKWGGDIYAGSYVIGLQTGQSPETLNERQGGGLPYTDPDGVTRNAGVILDGVYADGTPNDKVVHHYFKYLPNAGGWGRFLSAPGVLDNSWVKLREVSLSYTVPGGLLSKVKVVEGLNVSLVGRDLLYLYSSLPDRINPEGANGAGNAQGLEWASFPGMRSFGFRIQADF
ncbi:SusC/RagA family TonB-linked outer membrane protein [bacterium]|nr:SusC/RagA family TonB-linked outer membrane protein [bacterium]